jgi:hypothetical protein
MIIRFLGSGNQIILVASAKRRRALLASNPPRKRFLQPAGNGRDISAEASPLRPLKAKTPAGAGPTLRRPFRNVQNM